MASKFLRTILRLREIAQEQARRELLACLHAEQESDQALANSDATRRKEHLAAASLLASTQMPQGFAHWLRDDQNTARAHKRRQEAASALTKKARARLTDSQQAKKGVEDMIKAHEASQTAEAERRAHLALEDMVRYAREEDI
jgi:hypothetical protein